MDINGLWVLILWFEGNVLQSKGTPSFIFLEHSRGLEFRSSAGLLARNYTFDIVWPCLRLNNEESWKFPSQRFWWVIWCHMLHPPKIDDEAWRLKISRHFHGWYYDILRLYRHLSQPHFEFSAIAEWRNRSPRRCCIAFQTLNTVRLWGKGHRMGIHWDSFQGSYWSLNLGNDKQCDLHQNWNWAPKFVTARLSYVYHDCSHASYKIS